MQSPEFWLTNAVKLNTFLPEAYEDKRLQLEVGVGIGLLPPQLQNNSASFYCEIKPTLPYQSIPILTRLVSVLVSTTVVVR